MSLDVKALPAFADVDSRLPADGDVRIAVQLLVMQAYALGQADGLMKGEAIGLAVLDDIKSKLLTHSLNTDHNT